MHVPSPRMRIFASIARYYHSALCFTHLPHIPHTPSPEEPGSSRRRRDQRRQHNPINMLRLNLHERWPFQAAAIVSTATAARSTAADNDNAEFIPSVDATRSIRRLQRVHASNVKKYGEYYYYNVFYWYFKYYQWAYYHIAAPFWSMLKTGEIFENNSNTTSSARKEATKTCPKLCLCRQQPLSNGGNSQHSATAEHCSTEEKAIALITTLFGDDYKMGNNWIMRYVQKLFITGDEEDGGDLSSLSLPQAGIDTASEPQKQQLRQQLPAHSFAHPTQEYREFYRSLIISTMMGWIGGLFYDTVAGWLYDHIRRRSIAMAAAVRARGVGGGPPAAPVPVPIAAAAGVGVGGVGGGAGGGGVAAVAGAPGGNLPAAPLLHPAAALSVDDDPLIMDCGRGDFLCSFYLGGYCRRLLSMTPHHLRPDVAKHHQVDYYWDYFRFPVGVRNGNNLHPHQPDCHAEQRLPAGTQHRQLLRSQQHEIMNAQTQEQQPQPQHEPNHVDAVVAWVGSAAASVAYGVIAAVVLFQTASVPAAMVARGVACSLCTLVADGVVTLLCE